MEGHKVGTGVCVPTPLPLQAECFGKAWAWQPQVDRWAAFGRWRSKGRVGYKQSIFPQNPSFTILPCRPLPPTDTEQEPTDNVTKQIVIVCKRKSLYIFFFFFFKSILINQLFP